MDTCKTTQDTSFGTKTNSNHLKKIGDSDSHTAESSIRYAAQAARAHMGLSPQPDVSILQPKPVSAPTQDDIRQAAQAARAQIGQGAYSRSMNQYEDDDTQELGYGLGEMEEVGESEGEEEGFDEHERGLFYDDEGYDSYS
jgi:hypothetical protein